MVATANETTPSEVRIQLKSGFPEGQYNEADGVQLSIPSHCGRKALRAVLLQLLTLEDEESPDFHFLVNVENSGVPLRTTLGKFLVRQKLSSESILYVTYYQPLPPPTKREPESPPLPSWLSSLSAHGTKLLAGSYCGTAIVDGEMVTGAHSAPIKSVAWSTDGKHFLTCGQDECVRVWDSENRSAVGILRAEDVGACSTFESVATTDGVAAAGAFDGSVWLLPRAGLGSTEDNKDEENGEEEEEEEEGEGEGEEEGRVENKKRKRPSECAIDALRLGEATGMCAGSANFNGPETLLTGGLEGVVRSWDIVSASLSSVIPAGGRAVTGVCVANTACVVSAIDGAVRVLDGRGEQGVVAACKRRGAHKGMANDVEWIERERSVVTGGADGKVKVWDLRAINEAVHTVAHGENMVNVLAVTGIEDGRVVVSGGSDGKMAKFDMR